MRSVRWMHGCGRRRVPLPQRAVAVGVMLAVGLAGTPMALLAQPVASSVEVTELPDVVVSASRREQQSFDAPAAIQSVGRDTIEEAGPQVNLSESINRIPGVTARNRQNYAQDLQVSIRGFGSRSTFGIRGLRLLIDGIPATMPDGQGQASTISLGSVSRIEVLRGPLAQLYGNAAGGVIQVFTGDGTTPPTAGGGLMFGSYGARRIGLSASGRWDAGSDVAPGAASGAPPGTSSSASPGTSSSASPGTSSSASPGASPGALTSGVSSAVSSAVSRIGTGLVAEYSDFRTDGYRDHSEARRRQFNAKLKIDASTDTSFSIVANVFDQPLSKDPIGLTRAQAQANPRQVAAIALTQDARKVVSQNQAGVVAEHRLDADRSVAARIYSGTRDLDNALSIPLAAQNSPTSAGGIVELDRRYGGVGLQYSHRVTTGAGRVSLVAGFDHDTMTERRRGFINNAGARGALKRDEDNKVANTDFFGQASWDLSEAWTLIGGLRSSRVEFRTQDDFITAGNPDDSGSKSFSAVNPVAGVVWHYNDRTNLYAHVGRGFETPTFSELGYRPGGASGLNFALNASRSKHAEVGAKFLLSPSQRFDAALFSIRTRDEIVVDTNVGGRTTFKNAGGTSREGIEMSYRGQFGKVWSATAALTFLDAEFRDGFQSTSGMVAAGNKLPGVPNQQIFAELAWAPSRSAGPFAGIEIIRSGRVLVNDLNSDSASSATIGNLRGGWRFPLGAWQLAMLARVENITDKRYFGSVIVNDGNERFFEPAPGRTWLVGANVSYRF